MNIDFICSGGKSLGNSHMLPAANLSIILDAKGEIDRVDGSEARDTNGINPFCLLLAGFTNLLRAATNHEYFKLCNSQYLSWLRPLDTHALACLS